MIALLTSRLGLAAIAMALVLGVIGVQTLRLTHAKHDLAAARVSLATATASLKASEALRASEYQKATTAVSDAEIACSARVQAALKSGAIIKKIVSKPYATDAVSHCPVRALLSPGELRDALEPASPSRTPTP